MEDRISSIGFEKDDKSQPFFDIVSLHDVLDRKPTDHSQFEHHRITFYAILIITDGEGVHCVNFSDYPFKKGVVFALRPEHIHKFFRSNAKGKLLLFSDHFALQYMGQQNSGKLFQLFNEHVASPKIELDSVELQRVLQCLEGLEREYISKRDVFSNEIIRGYLLVVLTQLLRAKCLEEEVFNKTKYIQDFIVFEKLVEENCAHTRMVSFYCEKMHLTTRTLNNVTHGVARKSAKNVIIDISLSKIKRLLMNQELSINQISFEMGFQETSHFFKFFRQHAGQTPKQFRIDSYAVNVKT